MPIHTDHGFIGDNYEVSVVAEEKTGRTYIEVKGKRNAVLVHITPSGLIKATPIKAGK